MKTLAKIAFLLTAAFLSQTALSDTSDEDFKNAMTAMKSGKATEGRVLLRKAADAGHQEARYELGKDFLGRGSLTQAGFYFQLAAEAGHAPSQVELGLILEMSDEDVEAKKYFEMASKQEHTEGDYRLASILLSGQAGVKDVKRARQLLTRAAEKGHEQSTEQLAFAYIVGGLDLTQEERNSPEALKWIQKASEADFPLAMEKMVQVYEKGLFGQPVDRNRANELQARIRKLSGENDGPKKKGRRSK